MYKKSIAFVFLFSLCLCLTACNPHAADPAVEAGEPLVTDTQERQTDEASTQNQALYVTFYKLPSPPNYKVITEQAWIQEVQALIAHAEKTPIVNAEPVGGWEMFLSFSDGTYITLASNQLSINNNRYTVDPALKTHLLQLYEQAEAPEQQVHQELHLTA